MRVQVVGQGRMGAALHHVLREAGVDVLPLAGRGATGRDADGRSADVVLLAVPDAEISAAAVLVEPGPIVAHLSGATTLAPLAPHERFSVHPLLSVTGAETRFAGSWAALSAAGERAHAAAIWLAGQLGLRTFAVSDADRAAYHASASIAANFLVTLESVAERLASTAGVPREALVPLARGALDNWEHLGAVRALTGPVARGDEATIARQRAAVTERLPDAVPLYDAMVTASRELAAQHDDTTGQPTGARDQTEETR
ncbi:Rossmann-like and DUF2520 domain-containing protein [Leucobacter japonicus]|uniref:Rossmann-like and DUF2520 domain-containing protein n=1 Tax=Leucobacter japonicus TaxID=1461259 RepID=UPI0006A7A961|nr:Rossmann-like and DUF2520 domain-containing protein [Leucobacter japonicus]